MDVLLPYLDHEHFKQVKDGVITLNEDGEAVESLP